MQNKRASEPEFCSSREATTIIDLQYPKCTNLRSNAKTLLTETETKKTKEHDIPINQVYEPSIIHYNKQPIAHSLTFFSLSPNSIIEAFDSNIRLPYP